MMAELIEVAASWRSLFLALIVFGFAPGFVLRLLVRIYPKDDPRRTELVAELYELNRLERLLFVAEQLETVLFEGVPHRVKAVRRSADSANIEPATAAEAAEADDNVDTFSALLERFRPEEALERMARLGALDGHTTSPTSRALISAYARAAGQNERKARRAVKRLSTKHQRTRQPRSTGGNATH